tara:strand:- start:277 stop:945 length:669 start_codon:yes stop_codon:yes gene_type:complete
VHNNSINKIQNLLVYKFKNKSILKLALTHSSLDSNPNNYERLEFLGDSIIDFIVSDWLFSKNKTANQGDLTINKSLLVSKKNLSLLGEKMNLIDYIIADSSVNLNNQSTVDRINADLYESIVAAIYLDSNYEKVKSFIYRTLLSSDLIQKDENYKGKLNELCHENELEAPIYNLILQTGPDHKKQYKVRIFVKNQYFFGLGTKIKEAEMNAAKEALVNLFCF